jgi:hypothetical protein
MQIRTETSAPQETTESPALSGNEKFAFGFFGHNDTMN